MRKEDISSLIVDTEPPSFLTERDLVRAMAQGCNASAPVSTVATRAPVWVPPTVSVENAAAIMVAYGLRHLVVLGPAGEPVGVLSIRDALASVLREIDASAWLDALGAPPGDVG
jgi:CBS domain-containing protein